MSRGWLVASLVVLACTDRPVDSGAGLAAESLPSSRDAREAIPAEWAVFEDTSRTGEVTTASLQLPAAKDINGLPDEMETTRLLLRCVDGKVGASIDTEVGDTLEPLSVPIDLDWAPTCE